MSDNKTQTSGEFELLLLHAFVEYLILIGHSQHSKVCYCFIEDCCYE